MRLDAKRFRVVMGALASGVTVVTTRDRQGRARGLTATAVCSVSLSPPLILVCVDRAADCYQAFVQADAFAVNVLRDDQEDLSRRFSSKDAEKFEGISHRPGHTGAPILADGLAHVECLVQAQYPGGDHTIFLGQAVASSVALSERAGFPLVHFRGSYARLGGETKGSRERGEPERSDRGTEGRRDRDLH
jgi:flavin reductase (DIM6/NTAB) family NADH-FMN oxidoreductase RutF